MTLATFNGFEKVTPPTVGTGLARIYLGSYVAKL